MRGTVAGLLMIGALAGCASLAVRPTDSLTRKVGKLTVRVPLSLLTLSASEFQIQSIESGRVFRAELAARLRELEAARARVLAAESYLEARDRRELADALAADLERFVAARQAEFGDAGRLERSPEGPTSPRCQSRVDGDAIRTDCR